MFKDNIEVNKTIKPNSAKIEELKSKIPEYFTTEGEFNIEKLKSDLKENNIDELSSGFRLDFIGKDYSKKQSGERPTSVIVPDQKHNSTIENINSKNLFFTGDNLEVMRHLHSNYQETIDCIYIDPPYNTGGDGFVYPDNFEYKDEELKDMFGLDDEELKNLKSIQGKSTHSAWLTFMYPRLYLAKKLLKDTGSIFISIDNNEQANLKLLMDEIFGEASFVTNIVQKHRSGVSNDKIISDNHNYLLFYVKNRAIAEKHRHEFGTLRTEEDFKSYNKNDDDGLGDYTLNPVTGPGGARKGNPFYKFLGIENYWRFSKETMNKLYKEGRIIQSGKTLYQKTYRSDMENKKKGATTWWDNSGTTSTGTNEIKKLFGDTVFDFPKPTKLIMDILKFSNTPKDALILDFFAGSSTTADAIMKINAEDGGKRKFIMITLPEPTYTVNKSGIKVPTKGGNPAFNAGFNTIDEISRERIKRAASKIKNENGELSDSFDSGFKHYYFVSPTIKMLDQLELTDDMQLDLFDDMVNHFSSEYLTKAHSETKPENDFPWHGYNLGNQTSGIQTILQTWLVSDGYQFDISIKSVEISEYIASIVDETRIYLINKGWGTKNTRSLVNLIGKNKINIQTVVVYGYSFEFESLRELEIALKQLNTKVNMIVRY
ncbi:site-specific DNA-methyltransferase [Staphylococcus haemolyticus]|uniref:site-specific DNA-methyltransferase n=1 Tax=Staphylococcus haemolyticus TaxID=1283 RepID=UPI0011A1AC74|nr:site-specific DNA-methyltransferase [Staphylococcus haemolyticus]MCE0453956.1 site-specific DNA-methyltransferase [Staphylococcus haemolyticus]MCH4370355.1 site-specific DNA-methyltransferase [Staphylococcus haemolyticus]MCH4412445.1 site-specific DNA-methyltransferase [Staphylococcus haemolyticus]